MIFQYQAHLVINTIKDIYRMAFLLTKRKNMVSVGSTIYAISDSKRLSLFKAIAASDNDCSEILITKLKITRKQFYSSVEKLTHAGLTKRISGKYSLTSLGKVTFSMLLKMETAIEYYWKLKAIDSIMMYANTELPEQERQKIIDMLIDDHQFKDVFATNNSNDLEACQSLAISASSRRK
jgi:hypothetical protein